MRKSKRYIKNALLAAAFLLSVLFLVITNFISSELSKVELAKVKKIAEAYALLNSDTVQDYSRVLNIIKSNTEIPIIITDHEYKVLDYKNLDSNSIARDSSYLQTERKYMSFINKPVAIPLLGGSGIYIFYQEQKAITLLRIFPYVQLLLTALFLIISYVAFSNSRLVEQNKVWVGMAKETAHQIGTPLSSLIGWAEYLKEYDKELLPVVDEIEKDLNRLMIITERFSKIGSLPELISTDLADVLQVTVDYLRKRISKHIELSIELPDEALPPVKLNTNLFSWVIENLTKNAADAIKDKGFIHYRLSRAGKYLQVDVQDNGSGMTRRVKRQVFYPGFSTKRRGWGLGLSLTKRIVEEYHQGKIRVKESVVGKGTTFRMSFKVEEP